MHSYCNRLMRVTAVLTLLLASGTAHFAVAGVSRAIQDKYRRDYDGKALFLRTPVFAERKYVDLSGGSFRFEPDPTGTARFKVGEQVRITGVDFGGDEIRFRIAAIAGVNVAEIVYRFAASLKEDFPESDVFDRALQATFTEGLKYADIENAKKGYIDDAFERYVRETMALTSSSREAVLKSAAAQLPAYQDALREVEALKGRNQDFSTQLSQSQAENRKMETELKAQQAEIVRLRGTNSALQEKIDSSASQLLHLGEEVRSARGTAQGYQRELSNLQQSLNIKVDAGGDIGSQIGELTQAVRKIQREKTSLTAQNSSLTTNVTNLETTKNRLTKQVEDLEASLKKKEDLIASLTSKEDSLARQYVQTKQAKENLENVVRTLGDLTTKIEERKVQGGTERAKISVYLKDVLLGSLIYALPERMSPNEEKQAEASFSTESIDYVRVSPDERQILRSLGDKLKVQAQLSSSSPAVSVRPDGEKTLQEVGERDRVDWRWKVSNGGTDDASLALTVQLVNRNSDAIPLLRREQFVTSANLVREVRESLHPIPLAVGALIGFVLFGIAGVFRRFRDPRVSRGREATLDPPPGSTPTAGTKRL
jgi:peptidoglycan hydrolase CwlO-like protein